MNNIPCLHEIRSTIDAESVADALCQMNTCEEGELFLLSKHLKRAELEVIARGLDIPFQKRDRTDRLKDKIIEGTIGFRLRSQAIRSNSI
ncbi:hypothetical protein Barb4_01328 [Bacteroidales bacterium Barb4]|nr:hypothetical protein Barb4_01328 [Bacteroidales bacterium Barb4]